MYTSNVHNRTSVHRVRLALAGLDISQSTTPRNELQAFWDGILPLNELEHSDHQVYEIPNNELPETLTAQYLLDFRPPSLPPQLPELPSSQYNSPSDLEHGSRISVAEPRLSETNELDFQVTNVWGTQERSMQSSSYELDTLEAEVTWYPTVCNQSMLDTAPEAILNHDIDNRHRSNLILEQSTAGPVSRSPQLGSPVVTFNCNRLFLCEEHCACTCHSKHRYKSPELFSNLLGSLFIGYTGLPFTSSKCNLPTCRQQTSRSIRISYAFPLWFVQKTLNILFRSTTATGPSFGLNVRNRINYGTGINTLTLARCGDIVGLIKLLNNREGSLNDVDVTFGLSPFYVRFQALTSRM